MRIRIRIKTRIRIRIWTGIQIRRQKKSDDEQPDITDIPNLESGKSAEQRRIQTVQRLKILTSDQMLSRSAIFLAQLQTGYNSEERKNEIRQLLYFLYRSKKLTKTIYKHLMNTI